MNYKDTGYKPRDDWIMGNDVIRIYIASKIPRRYYNSTHTDKHLKRSNQYERLYNVKC